MKTSERILVVATELFNERGERNVTASDIALELDISPGNLYYHYKGKDSILSAIFARFYRDVASALATPITETGFLDADDVVERSWLFLTVVMESMFATRFFYLNQNDLMFRYPDIDRGMRRLMSLKRQMAWDALTCAGKWAPQGKFVLRRPQLDKYHLLIREVRRHKTIIQIMRRA